MSGLEVFLRGRASSAQVWREVRRRWMVGGVLGVLALAVLAPRLGARGGALHSELSECVPLFYVYYSAGRRAHARALWAGVRAHARLHAVSVAHAHVVAPALCAALLTAFRDGVDHRIVQGVMAWSRGGGCAWLPLALSAHALAPSVTALVHAAALLLAPLASALVCGRASVPPLRAVLHTLGTTAAPFLAGLARGCAGAAPPARAERALRVCALALLYAECCERLCDSEGMLRVSDVLVTLLLEVMAVCCLAATSALYWRCGVLGPAGARLVLLCAVPRALDTRWEPGAGCAHGLARLPAVFLAPAQALLLAALVPDDTDEPAPPSPSPPALSTMRKTHIDGETANA